MGNARVLFAAVCLTVWSSLLAQDQSPSTAQVIAKAIPAVPGAVICPNHRLVSAMIERYRANWAETFQDKVTGGQSRLIRGEATSEPPLARYGCALAPAGTTMALESGNVVPVVTVKLPDGRIVRGVTDWGLVDRK